MKLKIDRREFREALQACSVVASKRIGAASNDILIETKDDNIIIKASNLDESIFVKLQGEIEEPGEICVSSSKLLGIVTQMQDSVVSISRKKKSSTRTLVSCGEAKVELPFFTVSSFPQLEFKELAQRFEVPNNVFKGVIDKTLFAIGDAISRPGLTGLNLKTEADSNTIEWTSGDSFRICQIKHEIENPLEADSSIVIPKKSISIIGKIIDFGSGNAVLSFDENYFQVCSGQMKFKTRLIEADYPDLSKIINIVPTNVLSVYRDSLISTLSLLTSVYSGLEGAGVKSVKLTIGKGEMLIETQNLEIGKGENKITCDYLGESFVTALNIKFFLDAVSVFKGANEEMLNIGFVLPGGIAVFENSEWENYKTVAMPVKIRW
jgi:DNA polymerase-3 subunit beta